LLQKQISYPGSNKNPKQMKKNFLLAVAISALISSCEMTDETFIQEKNTNKNEVTEKKSALNEVELYYTIINAFSYDELESYENNLAVFEKHTNDYTNRILGSSTAYEAIDTKQLSSILMDPDEVVNQLNCSKQVKMMIHTILKFDGKVLIDSSLFTEDEHKLLFVLSCLQADDSINDSGWKRKRTIAFAYGAQYSITKAILYAGAVELSI
jgi:lipopolysaccharide export LptBFGC system permease protein LptF